MNKTKLNLNHALSWEISTALLIKLLLLIGLWFLIFRWSEKPANKPDIAQHFALPALSKQPDLSQPSQENAHVR